MDYYVVLITTPGEEEATKITDIIVKENLAKCTNIISNIQSIYQWEGKIERGKETLMIVKTKKEKFKSLVERVKELHSYTVPEIVALPIVEGSKDYLDWLNDL